MSFRITLTTALLAASLIAAEAHAQQPSSKAGAADALFRAGREALQREDWAVACSKFRESYRLDPAIGTLLNRAICEEELGNLATAWEHLQEVLRTLPSSDSRREIAAQRASALAPRVPKLTLQLEPSAPDDTTVKLDGVTLTAASFGVALPLNPGEHELVVQAAGHDDKRVLLTLAEGRSLEHIIVPGARQVPATRQTQPKRTQPIDPPPGPRDDGERGGGVPTAAWVAGGVGVVGLAVGGVFGLMVLDRKSTVDDHCDANDFCDDEGLDAGDEGARFSTIATVGTVVGLVGIGAAAAIWIGSGDDAPAVGASAGPGGGRVVIRQRF